MPVIIPDNARRLGTSIATVSRALAEDSEIALKTRRLVQQTVPEVSYSPNPTSDGGSQAVKRMRWLPDPPDALVCINDETAIGAMHAVHELGLKVGGEVAVTGFDGVQASRHTDPPLTTLDVPAYEVARQLVGLLVAEINGQPTANRKIVIQPRLLARASSQKQ